METFPKIELRDSLQSSDTVLAANAPLQTGGSRAETDAAAVGEEPLRAWERWARHLGYIAEGGIYALLGIFALLATVALQRLPTGSGDLLARIAGPVLGKVLVALLALGLSAFVVWQFLVAISDPEHRSRRTTLERRLQRLSHLFTGVVYVFMVAQAVWTLIGFGTNANASRLQVHWTARAFLIPTGRSVVSLIGVAIIAYAVWQFYRGITSDKTKHLDLRGSGLRIPILGLAAYGLTAIGLLFGLLGVHLVVAAWRGDPHYSNGIGGALGELKTRPFGHWLLGIESCGLISYGLYLIVKERYRRLRDR